MSKTYPRNKCWVCGKITSSNGLALTNHMRMHVRQGLVVERLAGWNPIIKEYGYFEYLPANRRGSGEDQSVLPGADGEPDRPE